MHIVAITASDKTFVHSMVIRPSKISFGSGVASVTETGLRSDKEVFGFFGIVRRMAV
jgi:hypothetical protein